MALEYTRSGWPQYKDKVKLAAAAPELYSVKDDLSEFDALLVLGCVDVIAVISRWFLRV